MPTVIVNILNEQGLENFLKSINLTLLINQNSLNKTNKNPYQKDSY